MIFIYYYNFILFRKYLDKKKNDTKNLLDSNGERKMN